MLPGEKEIRNPRRRVVRRIARSTASESQDLAVENQKSIYGLVNKGVFSNRSADGWQRGRRFPKLQGRSKNVLDWCEKLLEVNDFVLMT
jgi:hypothetical protein